MKSQVSPRQVARAIGVSESTLKRWCDRGLIPMRKTAGGHRRMAVSDVIAFLRESGHEVAQPELLGLPAAVGRSKWTLDRARNRFLQALISGHRDVASEVVTDLLIAGHAIPMIFDFVIAGAIHELGEGWSRGEVAIYEERRACEICMSLLRELRARVQTQSRAGQRGSNLPVETLCQAVDDVRPDMFWLSVSHVWDESEFVSAVSTLAATARSVGTKFIFGGQAIRPEHTESLSHIDYCKSFDQLVSDSLTEAGSRVSDVAGTV
jgi:excisionase family DNA binding protein